MQLKYRTFIAELKLSINCPDGLSTLDEEIEVYRVSCNPITHENNFLPNIVIDKKVKFPGFDYSEKNIDEIRKCMRCGASFFKSAEKAEKVLAHFTKKNQNNYGYSCIAKGTLNPNDGLIKNSAKSDHITLYEFEKVELHKKFKIL